MTDAKTAEINLKSVQRIDREAISIIAQATHVALYRFDMATQGWQKDEVEGPLFVYRRSAEPYFSFLIANRQSPQDFILQVTSELALKDQPPYIFLYRPNGLINGLWFSRDTDGKRFYDLISKMINNPQSVDVDSLKRKEPRPPTKKPPQVQGPVHGHVVESPVKKEPVSVMDRLHAAAANNKKQHAAVVQTATQPTTSTERTGRQPDVKPTVEPKKANAQHTAKKTVSAAASASSAHSEPAVQNGVTLLKRDSIRESPTGAGLTRDQAIEAIEHMLRTDDELVNRMHTAYTESMLRRLRDVKKEDGAEPTTGLTREQLAEAFEHMLRTDEGLIEKIHIAYTESMLKRLLRL